MPVSSTGFSVGIHANGQSRPPHSGAAREDSLGRAIKETHGEYTSYLNTNMGWLAMRGRVDSNPFRWKSRIAGMRFVMSRENPVRAGMVERAEHYVWSSAAAHCGLREDIASVWRLPGR